MWIDSHCHLDLYQEPGEVREVIARAREGNVGAILTVGVDLETSRRAVDLASEHESVWAGVGVHPHEAKDFDSNDLAWIRRLTEEDGVVAIGETGLDYYRDIAPRDKQREAFTAQIDVARELDLALVVHIRDSHDDVFGVLAERGPPARLVFHCFSGDTGHLRRALDLGGFISFAGNITFKNADALREVAKACPIDRVLVETDSPFLAPMPHRGKRNEPFFLRLVGEAVAAAMGESAKKLAEATSQNAFRLFRDIGE
jgi:TatD DNase family protein